MLLESKPLLGVTIYEKAIENVIAAYWRDYTKHKNEFIPAFLANDILRLWRTFCLNYEAGTTTEPERKRAERKLKNYKLKHSRLLTCYSALLYFLAICVEKHTVHPEDAIRMTQLSPTERLEDLLKHPDLADSHETIVKLLANYESFLEASAFPKEELLDRFLDAEKNAIYSQSERELGNLMFSAIEQIGRKSDFHRVLVV